MIVLRLVGGLGSALATTRLIARLLYVLTSNELLTIALAPLLLPAVAALAVCLPWRRAARVDPMVALRHE